jgi:hypothetical protein
MGSVEGFDMTPFNRFRPTQLTLSRSKSKRRSDSGSIFEFAFTRDELLRHGSGRVEVTARGGRVLGIVQWLRFHLADGVLYDTGDDEDVTAFGLQYHAVDPFDCESGQRIAIDGAHDRHGMWFWISDAPARSTPRA